jgi:transcriptional regulator with XRE-family HTH domain
MKARGLSQQELARRANLSQGVVSRAVDPSYGNLTLNTIIRIAAGFDVAFIGRFVPFSELARWYSDLPEKTWDIPSFEQEEADSEGRFGQRQSHSASGDVSVENEGTSRSWKSFWPTDTRKEEELESLPPLNEFTSVAQAQTGRSYAPQR